MFRVRELTIEGKHTVKPLGVYVIDEIVTTEGHYITWEEKFSSKENAKKHLEKFLHKQGLSVKLIDS